MADLLLELFSEEIPARMQAGAVSNLCNLLLEKIAKASPTSVPNTDKDFGVHSVGTLVTPRRLAVIIKNLPVQQPDISTELKGPKLDAPEQALQGFLKKSGMKVEQLEKRDGIYIAKIEQKGKPTADVLKTTIEEILANFPWPKSMRWGSGEATWVRPLHSILCIFDGKTIPVTFAGITSGNKTRGHRFLAPAEITITTPADYEAALTKAFVIADREKRKAEILKQAEEAAAAAGLLFKKDDALLEEVTGLVEFPVVLTGTIDAAYMDLPKEVLVSEMRAHQKYFALENKDGSLSDKFLITANTKTKDGKAVIAGNERVLRARLADGRFFWDQDRKKSLADWAEGLKTVTFHAKLGSIADKVTRIATLADTLADYTKADKKSVRRAAALCKADLVTGMVGEFPDLQGVMGRYYAIAQKEDASVADAIRDHYKPQGPTDSVPANPIGITIALADKLDTLISMFAIGEKPTGSKDPFALRRAALGIIRIILENNLRIDLEKVIFKHAVVCMESIANISGEAFIDDVVKEFREKVISGEINLRKIVEDSKARGTGKDYFAPKITSEVTAFFADRLVVQLKDSGIRHDVIKAVLSGGDDDLVRVVARARALQDFLTTDDGKNLLAAYKRAANIVGIEEKKDKITYESEELKATGLKETEETSLLQALDKTSSQTEPLLKQEKFVQMMALLAQLRAPVDVFFDKIMVNCDDKELRANRLRLLSRIRGQLDGIANFALIEG